MNIKSIGKYTIIQDYWWKQIYSPHNRMLQISNRTNGTHLSYVDTHLMHTLKEFRKVIIEE